MDKKRVKKITELLLTSLNDKVFTGVAWSYTRWVEGSYERYMSYHGFDHDRPFKRPIGKSHLFDLASLTKPLVTVPLLLSLFDKGRLSLDSRLGEIFPGCPEDKQDISIEELMSHSAGFVGHREYFRELRGVAEGGRKRKLLERILEDPLRQNDTPVHCYSDLGYILLGMIIEKVSARDLGTLSETLLYRPLGIQYDLFYPNCARSGGLDYVSTKVDPGRPEMLSGVVHDDNCRVAGGILGHAGLFGTLPGVTGLCEALLDQWQGRKRHPAYANTLLQQTLKRVGRSSWTMGFNRVSRQGSSSGIYLSRESVGHLGFTGTSFWIDPEKKAIAVLLSNRVYHGGGSGAIKKLRPSFHNILMAGQ